jgi:hypothetical protein
MRNRTAGIGKEKHFIGSYDPFLPVAFLQSRRWQLYPAAKPDETSCYFAPWSIQVLIRDTSESGSLWLSAIAILARAPEMIAIRGL